MADEPESPAVLNVVGRREDPKTLGDALVLSVQATLALTRAVMALRDAMSEQEILAPMPQAAFSEVGESLGKLNEIMDLVLIYADKKK